ncbi:MAG: hypothetical protein QM784_04170 [Polyangiaceae bacterium]
MPMHFALERAFADPHFARSGIVRVWERLTPSSIDVQVEGGLVKLQRHQGEYLVLALMTVAYKRLYCGSYGRLDAVTAAALATLLTDLPDSVVPEYRRRRAYLSAMLSKNEFRSTDPHSRRLFARERHGEYLPYEELKIRITRNSGEPDWVPIFEVLGRRILELHVRRSNERGPEHPNFTRLHSPAPRPIAPRAFASPFLETNDPYELAATPRIAPTWKSTSKKRRK